MKRIFIIAIGILLSFSAYAQKVKIEHLTKKDFLEKVFNYETSNEWKYLGTKPCIIDFYASWCGPCKRLAPILEELAEEYKEDIIIYKIDTEAERELAAAFQVSSIPMILFCPMEGQPQMAKGLLPKETLVEAITTVLIK
ncbi:MAG: thioredoxin [bacterium]